MDRKDQISVHPMLKPDFTFTAFARGVLIDLAKVVLVVTILMTWVLTYIAVCPA
jgi:hypothetical protein